MRYVWYALLAWLLYRFIFKLVIPVYRTSRKIKKGFSEMQEKMNEQYRQQQQNNPQTSSQKQPSPKPKSSDYIDFEEIKN